MGFFSKESCCLCGEKTGLLDKKCASGKVCKNCRGLLSVWFDDYKNCSADDLKAQLAQKESDLQEIKNYHFTEIYGECGVILLDPQAQVFTAFPTTSTKLFGNLKTVTSIDDVLEMRPDLIHFDQVESCELDITETNREEKHTVDGKQESYDPPHLTYMESFTLRLKVNHPYITSVSIPLNSSAIQIKHIGRKKKTNYGTKIAAYLLDLPGLIKENQSAIYQNDSLIDWFYHSKYEMPKYSFGFTCSRQNWPALKEYHRFLIMAAEIQNIIFDARESTVEK